MGRRLTYVAPIIIAVVLAVLAAPFITATTLPQKLTVDVKTFLKGYDAVVANLSGTVYALNKFGQVLYAGTNASKAIQTAIDYVSNEGGGTIFITSGIYVISRPIILPSGYPTVWLVGAGWDQTGEGTVIKNAGDDYALKVKEGGFFTGKIMDLAIVGNGTNNGAELCMQGGASIEDVLFYNLDVALKVPKFYVIYIHNVLIRKAGKTSPAVQFLGSSSKSDNLYINGMWFMSSGNINLYIENATLFFMNNLAFDPVDQAIVSDIYIRNSQFGSIINSKLLINTYGIACIELNNTADIMLANIDMRGPGTTTSTYAINALSGNVVRLFMSNVNIHGFGDWVHNSGAYIAQWRWVNGQAYTGSKTLPYDTIVKNVIGLKTENEGKVIFSGDGVTTTFIIPHGLVGTPTSVNIIPGSADAMGQFYVTVNATDIIVTYATAPPNGTNNIVLYWQARIGG